MGLGALLAALRSRCLSGVFHCIFYQRTLPGGDGAVHLHFDALDARLLPFPLVRRHVGNGRRRPRPAHAAGPHRERHVPPRRTTGDSPGPRTGGDSAVFLGGLLRKQPQARIAGVPGARHLTGAVGRADGRGAIAKSAGRNVWQRQPPVWPGAADAAGHCHGDGAV